MRWVVRDRTRCGPGLSLEERDAGNADWAGEELLARDNGARTMGATTGENPGGTRFKALCDSAASHSSFFKRSVRTTAM
jgi:hypothetical protein